MPSLKVPPMYRDPLAELARLDDQTASALVEALHGLPRYAPVTEILGSVQDAIGDPMRAAAIVGSLLSLRGQMREVTPDELAETVSESDDLGLDEDSRALLRRRLADALGTDALSTTAVAVDLQTQHQRNYQSARIFTDIRPVFQDDLEAGPSGAVIVETLQLQTWNRTGGGEEFFVALDEADLHDLQRAVERAVKKTDALRTFLDQKGVPYFELERGDSS